MSDVPLDIQHGWLSVIRRLQSVSKSGGLQVIKISILVDENGDPQAWMEPEVYKIEPRSKASALLTLYSIGNKT